MKCVLYACYSSEGQREASIYDQYRVCEEYVARQNGWEVVKRYKDGAISGTMDANGREGYRQCWPTRVRGFALSATVLTMEYERCREGLEGTWSGI